MNHKSKTNRGITIISLVITIIILLILAGVTINLTFGENGLLKRAEQGKNAHEIGMANDINEMNKATEYINKYFNEENITEQLPENTPETQAGTNVQMPNEWYTETPTTVSTPDGTQVIASKKVASVEAIADGTGKTVPVPKGFYYVGGTVETGVVISDNIKDKNKYAGEEKAPNGNVPAGVTYNADGTVDSNKSELQGNQFIWIPCTIEDYTKVDFEMQNYIGQWDTSTNTAEKVQIEKYKGFYIGRYEAGTSEIKLANNIKFENASTATEWQNSNFVSSKVESGKITSKAGEIPYYHADYTTAVEMSEKMYNTESVKSGLITGTMWDTVMKYITTDKTGYTDLKNTSWGNYNTQTEGVNYTAGQGRYISVNSNNGTTTENFTISDNAHHYGIRTTASSEGLKKKNIYDIAGNLWEWTQEMCYLQNTNKLMYNLRGGDFHHESSSRPVCYRECGDYSYNYTNIGFRPALYIK